MTGDPWSFNVPNATWFDTYPPGYVPPYTPPATPPVDWTRYYHPTPPVPTAAPVHPLVGKVVRIEWKREGVAEDENCEWVRFLVLDAFDGLIKLRAIEDDRSKTPLWSPIWDIYTLEEVAEIVPGEE